jgi:hypothetical protein
MELTTFCPHVLLAFEPLLCPGSCLNDLTLDPPPSEGNLGTDEIYARSKAEGESLNFI